MAIDKYSFSELEARSPDPKRFRELVAAQLEKDFSMCGVVYEISDFEAPTIIEELQITVGSLIAHDSKKLVQFLYRVDLNEKLLQQLIQQGKEDISIALSAMILEREGKKVLSRLSWS